MMRRQFLAAAGMAAMLAFAPPATADSSDTYRQLDLLMDVFERIRAEYVEEVEDREVIEAAINGMLSALDPHSSYLGPDNFRQMQVQTDGEYGGLGLEVSMENGVIRVISPIDETPAARAGIQGGDYITHIDGEQVMGQTLSEAVEKMRGPVNTPVTVTIVREGVEQPFDVDIVRASVQVRSVRHRIERDTIGYLRITTFNKQTSKGLRDALETLEEELDPNVQGLVLDLRNNPGGLLDQAISVSDMFLDKGEIVSTRGRRAKDSQRWHATAGDLVDGAPIIVLVNAYSASASEIVAGALQDHRRAIILGVPTFGKGTVQTIIPLGTDSAMRLTTARYYTPAGRSIQELGIEPDIEVDQLQVQATADNPAVRRERDLRGHIRNENGLSDRPEEQDEGGETDEAPAEQEVIAQDGDTPLDYQLNYALDLLEGISLVAQRQALTH